MICITATGSELNAFVDPRFGRCSYFLFVDEKKENLIESVANFNYNAMHGAGITAAQIVAEKGPEVLITGNIGPNAFNVLKTAGIKVVAGVSGKVMEIVKKYKEGRLKFIESPSVEGHYGNK